MLGLLRLAVRRALLVEVETESEPGGTAPVREVIHSDSHMSFPCLKSFTTDLHM
jgi:hypothetical protein